MRHFAVSATTRTLRRRNESVALDCVKVLVVREGSLILDDQRPPRPVASGTVLLVAPHATLGFDPEGSVTVTALFIDTDYLIEHLFWQHLDVIPDRDAARDLAARLYPDPFQVLRLGEQRTEQLGP